MERLLRVMLFMSLLTAEAFAAPLDDLLLRRFAEDAPVGAILGHRDAIQREFSALPAEQKKDSYKRTVSRLNELFLFAQVARLRAEIEAELRIEADDDRYKGWERAAARRKAELKQATLKMVQGLPAGFSDKPISCLSELARGGKALPAEAQAWAQSSTQVYSKGGGGASFSMGSLEGLMRFDPKDYDRDPAVEAKFRKMLKLSEDNEFDIASFSSTRSGAQVGRRRLEAMQGKSFEQLLTADERRQLAELGVTDWKPQPQCRDYSQLYSSPRLQPPRTAMCAGYAIANDMESILNRGLYGRYVEERRVSPEYTYVAVLSAADPSGAKQADRPICSLLGRTVNPLRGVGSIAASLQAITERPVCSVSTAKEVPAEDRREYVIGGFRSVKFEKPPSISFMTALLDGGVTPMLTISSEARTESEDWIRPNPFMGDYKHVLNVVGYCSGRDPDCLREEDYFLVRDSLGKEPIHYKVSARSLLGMTEAADKITDVRPVRTSSSGLGQISDSASAWIESL